MGVIALHANWPAYPAEHGWEIALRTLGMFPPDTRFEPIDDIDRCVLFVAEASVPKNGNKFHEDALHAALWHKDLLDLTDRGMIRGVARRSEEEWEERRRNYLRDEIVKHGFDLHSGDPLDSLGFLNEKGDFVPIALPALDEYDSEDYNWPVFVDSTPRIMLVQPKASEALDDLWRSSFDIPSALEPLLLPMLRANLYDSAVREASVQLEQRLRMATESTMYGLRLVDLFIERLAGTGRYIGSYLKLLRFELRTAFKFVRNDFAHCTPNIDRARAYTLLSRMCELVSVVDKISHSGSEESPSSA